MIIKTRLKKMRNLLNNQNYILGKTEKKKLLSKFFVDNSIISFYKLIGKYNNYFSILGFIFFIYLFSFNLYVVLFFVVGYLYMIFMSYILDENDKEAGIYIKRKRDVKNINHFKEIFIDKVGGNQILSNIIIVLFVILSFYVHLVLLLGTKGYFNIYGLSFYYYVLFSIVGLSFYYKTVPLNINLGAIVFIPFLMILYLFKIIYSFFDVLFIKKIEGYFFIKQLYEGDISRKFNNINDSFADNYYYIIVKK